MRILVKGGHIVNEGQTLDGSIVIEDGDEDLWIDNRGGNMGTFYGSNAQKTIYIGRNLALTDTNAPFNNTISVEFGSKVTYINDNLFRGADLLSNVKMADGITSIDPSSSFQDNSLPSFKTWNPSSSSFITESSRFYSDLTFLAP